MSTAWVLEDSDDENDEDFSFHDDNEKDGEGRPGRLEECTLRASSEYIREHKPILSAVCHAISRGDVRVLLFGDSIETTVKSSEEKVRLVCYPVFNDGFGTKLLTVTDACSFDKVDRSLQERTQNALEETIAPGTPHSLWKLLETAITVASITMSGQCNKENALRVLRAMSSGTRTESILSKRNFQNLVMSGNSSLVPLTGAVYMSRPGDRTYVLLQLHEVPALPRCLVPRNVSKAYANTSRSRLCASRR